MPPKSSRRVLRCEGDRAAEGVEATDEAALNPLALAFVEAGAVGARAGQARFTERRP